MSHNIKVGQVIHGFHQGYFGRDSYGCRRVEAVGADWILTRKIAAWRGEQTIEVVQGEDVQHIHPDLTCEDQWPGQDVECDAEES